MRNFIITETFSDQTGAVVADILDQPAAIVSVTYDLEFTRSSTQVKRMYDLKDTVFFNLYNFLSNFRMNAPHSSTEEPVREIPRPNQRFAYLNNKVVRIDTFGISEKISEHIRNDKTVHMKEIWKDETLVQVHYLDADERIYLIHDVPEDRYTHTLTGRTFDSMQSLIRWYLEHLPIRPDENPLYAEEGLCMEAVGTFSDTTLFSVDDDQIHIGDRGYSLADHIKGRGRLTRNKQKGYL